MLDFFRRYQRAFFLVITVVIVISFSFFGTYNTIPGENLRDQTAFTAIDGTQVSRSDLEEMVLFLSTDADDKVTFGGVWGPNFLNDGVIRKDILQTGLAEVLAEQYPLLLAPDLQKRLEKEKRYKLYVHPQAEFLNIEAVWEYFAPDMKSNYATLKRASSSVAPEVFMARVRLYLGERRLPPPLLRQILRFQEKQNNWVTPDANLDRTDLSLFGYHTMDDWFGPNFLRIVTEFIINASIVAEQKGYVVTKEEAFADLMRNAQTSYQQNIKNPNLGVANSTEYFHEQLRRMNMDQTLAVKLWRQVLLFKRLFQDIGHSVLVDSFSFEQVNAYAKESASGDLYALPKELQIGNYQALQKLEAYLAAVSKPRNDPLQLPLLASDFLAPEEVAKKYPELVQKRYLLEISQVDKKNLQSKVSVKDSWNWQVENAHWAALKKEFPELGTKKGDTREERFAALESLDNRTRGRVDAFARKMIIDSQPDFVQQALNEATPSQVVVGITSKGDSPPFKGLKDPKKLTTLLDQAPLAGEEDSASEESKQAQEQLNIFTDNDQEYFRIRVLERNPKTEILTFTEANKKGVLDLLVGQQLESYYQQIRGQNPSAYQKEDKSWKPLAEVKNEVANQYFARVLQAIRADFARVKAKDSKQELATGDNAAPYRLHLYTRSIKEKLAQNPDSAGEYVRDEGKTPLNNSLGDRLPLADQWKLEKKEHFVQRTSEESKFNPQEIFAMDMGLWTPVQTLSNGEIYFFHKTGNESKEISALVADKINQARRLFSDDSQKAYMKNLLVIIKEKNAIGLDYLNQSVEMEAEGTAEEVEG